jgi:hypothetical protein
VHMRRPLCAFLAAFLLVATVSEAQERKAPLTESPSPDGTDATILNFLQQSHDLGQQLQVPDRLMLLAQQAELVSRFRADLGRAWANELFALSLQTNGGQRSSAQDGAMRILLRLDPDRALELLHSLTLEEPHAAASPLAMPIVREVFDALVARDGERALPLLEQDEEGLKGHYPYSALGHAAMQATVKYWGSNKERAVQILQSVLQPAFARYRENAQGYFDDVEFGRMLQELAGGLPLDSIQPALHTMAKNLLSRDTSKYHFEAEVYTNEGETAKVHNAIDAAILSLGSLINRDPELDQQLMSARPELQAGLQYIKEGRTRLATFGPALQPQNAYSPDPALETRIDAMRLSNVNPDAAIAKAEQLPDNAKRASTLLEIARSIAGDYPERAAELIAEIQGGDKPPDAAMDLDLVSAQISVAASKNKNLDELHDLLQRGFASAYRVISDQQRTGEIHFFIVGLVPLVQIGMQNDPDSTISFVESLPPSHLKAGLLISAASALSMRSRLPLSSRPQQRGEKTQPIVCSAGNPNYATQNAPGLCLSADACSPHGSIHVHGFSALCSFAIGERRRTVAAAENRTMSFLSDISCAALSRRAGSPRLAMASSAAARTAQFLSEAALARARLVRGSGSPANSLAAAARVGEVLLFFQARTASIPYPRKG